MNYMKKIVDFIINTYYNSKIMGSYTPHKNLNRD